MDQLQIGKEVGIYTGDSDLTIGKIVHSFELQNWVGGPFYVIEVPTPIDPVHYVHQANSIHPAPPEGERLKHYYVLADANVSGIEISIDAYNEKEALNKAKNLEFNVKEKSWVCFEDERVTVYGWCNFRIASDD